MEYLRQVADSRSAGFACMRKQSLHSSRTPLSTLFHARSLTVTYFMLRKILMMGFLPYLFVNRVTLSIID